MVALGHRLERELGIAGSRDTLARWMAHRIAELMQRAKTAPKGKRRETAKAECAEAILQLWLNRAHLPAGAPLAPFADFLERFMKEADHYPSLEIKHQPKTWTQALPRILSLLDRELLLWRDAALAEQPLDAAQQAVQSVGQELDSEEARVLQLLADARNRAQMALIASGQAVDRSGVLTPAKRNRAFVKAMKKLNQDRAVLLAAVMQNQRPAMRK